MERLRINGGRPLSGTIEVSRSKNSALPIMAAVLCSTESVTLDQLPDLRDVRTMNKLLSQLGVEISDQGNGKFSYNPSSIRSTKATYDLVKTMRASILVLGPLVGRFGHAQVSLPGGCAIGTRPIDIHLKVLEELGAEITIEKGYVEVRSYGLVGKEIELSFPSVGATENALMTAIFAQGETVLKNVAKEPEIVDLGNFLMTAFPDSQISGLGTSEIRIKGNPAQEKVKNKSLEYTPIYDRIEAATYVIAGLMVGKNLKVRGVVREHLESFFQILEKSGADLSSYNTNNFELDLNQQINELKGFQVSTEPFPGFPTDIQAQLVTLASFLTHSSEIEETVFENRFMHVAELRRMGAEIELDKNKALISPILDKPIKKRLSGAPVMCTDLRASAALVLAGLTIDDETIVNRVYHIDRGYQRIDEKLRGVGADITRENE